MSNKKNKRRPLVTDKKTDYLFDYFMNEEKINEQLKSNLDEETRKKIENHNQPKLDSRIQSNKNSSYDDSPEEIELPENSVEKPDVEFNDDLTDNDANNANDANAGNVGARNFYGKRMDANPSEKDKFKYYTKSESKNQDAVYGKNPEDNHMSERPLLGEKLIGDVQKYIETPEEKRARQRDAYSNLQDIKIKYGIELSKDYNIDDDPDEMEAEYTMHKERRNKTNQVKLYKSILLNIIFGAEVINDKYNPFEIKLKDWSKQVATDMDDYTEVLEELYEKYKDKGGKMAPEIRLLFMIIMSGVTFHLSNTLFGQGGLDDTIKKNPNLISGLLGGLVKGKMGGGVSENVGIEKQAPHNNQKILDAIRKHNQKVPDLKSDFKSSSTEPTTTSATTVTSSATETNSKNRQIEQSLLEQQRKLISDQQAMFEERLKMQNEMHIAQLEQLRNQNNIALASVASLSPSNSTSNMQSNRQFRNPKISSSQPVNNKFINQLDLNPGSMYSDQKQINQVLSDAGRKPRFMENPLLNLTANINSNSNANIQSPLSVQSVDSDNQNIFDSEIKDNSKQTTKNKIPSVKQPKNNYIDYLDTLEKSTDINLDDIIESSTKNKKQNKSTLSTNKPKNNSATKSTAKSASRKKNPGSVSDTFSTTKKNNILKL